jgi:hypothetical protein
MAKAQSIAPGVAPPWHGDNPSREDADRSLQLVQELFTVGDAAILAAAFDVVWATTRALAAEPGAAGLIHGDLHQANYLCDGWDVRAIDFDDCGWGFRLYDVAVTLSELAGRPHEAAPRCPARGARGATPAARRRRAPSRRAGDPARRAAARVDHRVARPRRLSAPSGARGRARACARSPRRWSGSDCHWASGGSGRPVAPNVRSMSPPAGRLRRAAARPRPSPPALG